MTLEDCLLNFDLTSHAPHLYDFEGRSGVAVGIAYGMNFYDVRRKKPKLSDLDPIISNRILAIHQAIQNLCEQTGIPFEEIKALDHGKHAVVIGINSDHVIRMQLSHLPDRPKFGYILQALSYVYLPELNITIEILPKVTVGDIEQADIAHIALMIRKEGIVFFDQVYKNVGRDKDGRLLIIDPDSYEDKNTH
jgi:hypothetical protein